MSTHPAAARPATRRDGHLALVVLVLAIVATVVLLGGRARGQSTVVRLDAGTAVEAGLAVSREVFADGATAHVVLVRDDRFADALVAGPLAGELPGLAPILFTGGHALDPQVAEEIDRVTGGGGTVHVIGGTTAVSTAVSHALEGAGHVVQRVGGQTRIETAQAVFDVYFADDLDGGDVVLARAFGSTPAEDDAWPDAVTGGAFGAARGVPILLTPTDSVPAGVLTQLEQAGAVLVLGGTAAVTDTAQQQVAAVVDEVVRVADDTREGTAVAVATDLFGIPALTAADTVVLVNGRSSFAFGLAAAPLSALGDGAGEAPLLLVTEDSPTATCAEGGEVATPTACYLAAEGTEPGRIVIVGDTSQVSGQVESAVAALRGGDDGGDAPLPSLPLPGSQRTS